MLLSIIIPIYQVEKYIGGTLNSIYSQFNDDITRTVEVIMINDGSTDGSIAIAEQYYNRYRSCTKLIHQKNMGLSCARNTGLEAAQGQYIWFIDSDDSIAPDSLCKTINYIREYQADILAFDMVRINETSQRTKIHSIFFRKYNRYLYNRTLNRFHLISKIRETPVQKFIFRHEFLKNYQLTFQPGIFHEDNEYMVRCLFHAETIVPIPYAPYQYLIRSSGSITSSKNPKRIQDMLLITRLHNAYKKKHALQYRDKAFFDYYRFLTVHRVLKNKLFKECRDTISYDKKEVRKIIIQGLRASVYFNLWASVFKCFIDLYKNK